MKKLIRKIMFLFRYHIFHKRKISTTVKEKIGGFTFIIRPTVFNPKDYLSSELFAEFVNTLHLEGKYILDMGCGSGIISVFAASKGAKCVAADINPVSVRSTNENAAGNRFSDKIEVIESDLFESFKGSSNSGATKGFDIIFFNPPYFRGNPRNNFERAFKGGPKLEVINNFISASKNYLKSDGVIYFMVSSDMDINELENMFTSNGFEFKIIKRIKKLFETFYITEAVIN